jgi:hypothetical protein
MCQVCPKGSRKGALTVDAPWGLVVADPTVGGVRARSDRPLEEGVRIHEPTGTGFVSPAATGETTVRVEVFVDDPRQASERVASSSACPFVVGGRRRVRPVRERLGEEVDEGK